MDKYSWNDTWGQIDWGHDCKTKVKKTINELHRAGVNLNMMDYKGEKAPIHYIAEYYPSDVLALLLTCGALSALRAKDDLIALHYAVKGNKPENIKILLKYGVTGIERSKDKWGRTALDFAANAKMTDIVKILCDFNPNLANMQNNYGWTALHYAAFHSEEEMLKYLIELGADLNIKTAKGKTPLNCATKVNWFESNIIRMLIENGADVTGQADALNWAIRVKDKKMFETLLERGAVPNEDTLIEAVNREQLQMLKLVLDKHPEIINLHEDTPLAHTALHEAVILNDPKFVKVLLERGADVNALDSVGRTPFYMATKTSQNPEVIALLQKADKIRARYLKPKAVAKHNGVAKSDTDKQHE